MSQDIVHATNLGGGACRVSAVTSSMQFVLEHRSPTQLAREHGISKRWVFELLRRFKEGGYASLEPRSRRPKSCSHQIETKVQKLIVKFRSELTAAGHDAGPDTIAHHLKGQVDKVPSVATVWRILKRNGLINPQPHKRPKASFIRFEAKLPNETWQLDSTPWQLTDATRSRFSTSWMTSPGSLSPRKLW